MRVTLPIVVCSMCPVPAAMAQSEYRTWTSTAGTRIEARCANNLRDEARQLRVGYKEVPVVLETRDQRTIKLSFSQLSETDQRWLTNYFYGGGRKPVVPPDPTKASFKVLTEKEVSDPARLVFEDPGLLEAARLFRKSDEWSRRGRLNNATYTDVRVQPAWAVCVSHWQRKEVMRVTGTKSNAEAVEASLRAAGGWWPAFQQPEINQILHFLAAHNRTRDGSVAFKQVACRSGVAPTMEELARFNNSHAYGQLQAVLHLEGEPDEKLTLVVDSLHYKVLRFIHNGVHYKGTLERIDRKIRDHYDVKRTEAWHLPDLRPVSWSSTQPVLDKLISEKGAVLLIGEPFGTLFSVSPDFVRTGLN